MKKEEYEEVLLKEKFNNTMSSAINWTIATGIVLFFKIYLFPLIGTLALIVCAVFLGIKWCDFIMVCLSIRKKGIKIK